MERTVILSLSPELGEAPRLSLIEENVRKVIRYFKQLFSLLLLLELPSMLRTLLHLGVVELFQLEGRAIVLVMPKGLLVLVVSW